MQAATSSGPQVSVHHGGEEQGRKAARKQRKGTERSLFPAVRFHLELPEPLKTAAPAGAPSPQCRNTWGHLTLKPQHPGTAGRTSVCLLG